MRGLLFIGSAVADVVLHAPAMPVKGGDVDLRSQSVTLGGCACNAFTAARVTSPLPCALFAPMAGGVWGQWVREALRRSGVESICPAWDAEAGCCYCVVDASGERTFLCNRGPEYHFQAQWFDSLAPETYDAVYCCGLEIMEADGQVIVDALKRARPRRLLFAPGPHIRSIAESRMEELFRLSPILHLNRDEALAYTGETDTAAAAEALYKRTHQPVIVTLGAEGAYARSEAFTGTVPGLRVTPVDTIGAGDAHAGALLAALCEGLPLAEALHRASRAAAAAVTVQGGQLTRDAWEAVQG